MIKDILIARVWRRALDAFVMTRNIFFGIAMSKSKLSTINN
jgi:hypothetical protein